MPVDEAACKYTKIKIAPSFDKGRILIRILVTVSNYTCKIACL